MYGGGKIIIGLIVFVGLVTFPFWYTAASGKIGYVPELQPAVGGGTCVEDTEYMRAFHMDLLNEWREVVVRGGDRVYVASDGRKHTMSLSSSWNPADNRIASGSCFSCHTSKAQFCDRCHDYVGVSPHCWDCHVAPGEM